MRRLRVHAFYHLKRIHHNYYNLVACPFSIFHDHISIHFGNDQHKRLHFSSDKYQIHLAYQKRSSRWRHLHLQRYLCLAHASNYSTTRLRTYHRFSIDVPHTLLHFPLPIHQHMNPPKVLSIFQTHAFCPKTTLRHTLHRWAMKTLLCHGVCCWGTSLYIWYHLWKLRSLSHFVFHFTTHLRRLYLFNKLERLCPHVYVLLVSLCIESVCYVLLRNQALLEEPNNRRVLKSFCNPLYLILGQDHAGARCEVAHLIPFLAMQVPCRRF